MSTPQSPDPEQRFTALFDGTYGDVLRFVRRRHGDEGAEDVVAEAFLVAWRRLEDLPEDPGDARAWLFGIARGTLANSRRSDRRRDALGVRLAGHDARAGQVSDDAATLMVTTGVVGVDILRPTTASATWTPVGEAVPADAPGVQQCEQWWQIGSSELRPVLQERRGVTTLVLAADDQGRELLCTATLRDGQEPIGGMTSVEDPPIARLAPHEVSTTFVVTTFEEAMPQNGWQAEGSTAVAGDVGEDVTRVVLETGAGPVEASLAEGRFAAWWPIEDDSDPHPEVRAQITTADRETRTVTLRERG